MGVSVKIEGCMGRNHKYVSDNQRMFAALFERAGYMGVNFTATFSQQVSARGGGSQGWAGVRIKKSPGARGRRILITTQVAGNDSRYEFYVKTPEGVETSEFIEELEKAQKSLVREEKEPRAHEAIEKIIKDFEGCEECFTAFQLLPEALSEIDSGEYRVRRSVFELLDDEQSELLVKTCREIGVLSPVIGEGVDRNPVYCYNKKLYQKVVDELTDRRYLMIPAPADNSRAHVSSDLMDAEELVRDAELRLERVDAEWREIEKRIRARTEKIENGEKDLSGRAEFLEHQKEVVVELDTKVSQIQDQIRKLSAELHEAISDQSKQEELVQKLSEELCKNRTAHEEMVKEQSDDVHLEVLTVKNLERCKSDVEFAKSQLEELRHRPVREAFTLVTEKKLTHEQLQELIHQLEQQLK